MFSDTEATSNIRWAAIHSCFKIVLKEKNKTFAPRETSKYARIVGTGKQVGGNSKGMPQREVTLEKTIWDQLLKSLECRAKNFGLYPSGC